MTIRQLCCYGYTLKHEGSYRSYNKVKHTSFMETVCFNFLDILLLFNTVICKVKHITKI